MARRGYFLGDVKLHELAGHEGRWFALLSDLTYVDVDGTRYVAPAGTLTNFASIPRALWSVFPPYGKHTRAAVIHDWLCGLGEKGVSPVSSREAHDLFKRMLEACGCAWLTVRMFWGAVRGFGPRFESATTWEGM